MNCKKAFSLLELSITIIIIAILVIGVIGSKHIVEKARVNAARAMSSSSPINGVYDNELWLETSIDDEAFGADNNLSDGDNITSWFDRSNNQDKPQIEVVGSGPIYSNSINSIPAILFNSSSSTNHLKISDASFLNNTDYTIMITEQRVNQNSGVNYLLGGNDSDDTFGLGYSGDGAIIQTHGESSSSNNTASVETTAAYSNKPRVTTFTHSSNLGNKIYINATLANEDDSSNAKAHLSGIGELNIGKNYYGEIGEIAIFSRALKQVEIREIEDYMTDKYNAPNNRDTSSSCTNGTLTASGCDASCVVSVNGSSTTSIATGQSATISCDGAGYDGTSLGSFSCVNGSLDSTPASGACSSNCASGYVTSGDECVQGCSVGDVSGTSLANLTVADGASVTCDVTGYDGLELATCVAPNAISGICGCDDANNYTDSDSDGTCEAPCTLSSADSSLPSDVEILSGAISYDCSTFSGGSYTGNLTLASACSNGSTISVSSGSCANNSPFISTWRTTSSNETISLPLHSSGTYNFTIDWGDGSPSENITSSSASHSYALAGDHIVSITGTIQVFRGRNTGDISKLINISQWGPFSFGSQTDFYGATNLTISATDTPNLSSLGSLTDVFRNCSSLTTIPNINSWDTSNVVSMDHAFNGASVFNSDISNWDVSNIIHFNMAFNNAYAFNQDISSWDMGSATNLDSMFNNAQAFNQNISSWRFGTVTSTHAMFQNAYVFNQDISGWNLGSVTNMRRMFNNAQAFNQDISSWDVSSVQTMEKMFRNSLAFDQDLSSWDITSVTNFIDFFAETIGLSTANYDALLIGWAAQNVKPNETIHFSANYTLGGAAEAARNDLINNHGWNIVDNGGI